MNVKTLLDELCKFVAEMIAQRTPNEILDYFNIKKDATWEEEQELIATHKVSSPAARDFKPPPPFSSMPPLLKHECTRPTSAPHMFAVL
eukprot:COSAG02_NODE_51624_length_313_cov_0.630841_1_plen_88_part_10